MQALSQTSFREISRFEELKVKKFFNHVKLQRNFVTKSEKVRPVNCAKQENDNTWKSKSLKDLEIELLGTSQEKSNVIVQKNVVKEEKKQRIELKPDGTPKSMLDAFEEQVGFKIPDTESNEIVQKITAIGKWLDEKTLSKEEDDTNFSGVILIWSLIPVYCLAVAVSLGKIHLPAFLEPLERLLTTQ